MGLFGDYDAESVDETFGIPDGERDMVITDSDMKTSKKGNTGLMITFTDEQTKETLDMWQNLPNSGDPQKDENSAKWLKRLYKSLEIPDSRMNSVEPEDLIGIEVTGTVYTQQSGQYENKRIRNIHVRHGSGLYHQVGDSMAGVSGNTFSDEPPF